MPKVISTASVSPNTKTAPGLQLASLLKANPSCSSKREGVLANKTPIPPTQVESPGIHTDMSAAPLQSVQGLRDSCPPIFPQSIIQGRREDGRGITDLQAGNTTPAFF